MVERRSSADRNRRFCSIERRLIQISRLSVSPNQPRPLFPSAKHHQTGVERWLTDSPALAPMAYPSIQDEYKDPRKPPAFKAAMAGSSSRRSGPSPSRFVLSGVPSPGKVRRWQMLRCFSLSMRMSHGVSGKSIPPYTTLNSIHPQRLDRLPLARFTSLRPVVQRTCCVALFKVEHHWPLAHHFHVAPMRYRCRGSARQTCIHSREWEVHF